MGAWEELDTEISAELEFTDLDNLLSMNDEYGIFEPIQKVVEDIKARFTEGTKRAVSELAKKNKSFQEKWINKNCKNPSGMLASSIDIEGDDFSFIVGTRINDVYPMSVEFGHRDIYPVRAKALAFYDDSGELIFRKHVSDTFDNPRPFVAPAYDDTEYIAETMLILEIAHAGITYD